MGTYITPPPIERRFERTPPEFLDDPGATRLFDPFPSPAYASPPAFITTASDAMLIGYRAVLSGEQFFTDESFGARTDHYLAKLAQREPFPNEDTGLLPVSGDTFDFQENGRPMSVRINPDI